MAGEIHKQMQRRIDAGVGAMDQLPPRLGPDGKPLPPEQLTEQQLQPEVKPEEPRKEQPKSDAKEAQPEESGVKTAEDDGRLADNRLDRQQAQPQRAREQTSYTEHARPELPRAPQQGFGKASVQQAMQQALRKDMPEGPRGQQVQHEEFHADQTHMQFERPLPPEPTPAQYRALLQEPCFAGPPMKGSLLFQKLQAKSMNEQVQQQKGAQTENAKELLKKGDVVQLFRLRSQCNDKETVRQVLRYELAKLRQEARQKVQAIRYQTEGEARKEEANRSTEAKFVKDLQGHELLSSKLKNSGGDSAFEEVLLRVLEGEEGVPELPKSVTARFAAKSEAEWVEFFRNALNLSSAEVQGELALNRMVEALFRGLYGKDSKGNLMLVSDLTLISQGETDEAKFSRIPLNDESLAELFKNLQPGDQIGKELLQRLGEQLTFIKLAHNAEALPVLTDQQMQANLNELRQQRSAEAQRKMEQALVARRQKDDDDSEPTPWGFAGQPFKDIRERKGQTTKVMPMIYGVLFFVVVILLTWLFRYFQ